MDTASGGAGNDYRVHTRNIPRHPRSMATRWFHRQLSAPDFECSQCSPAILPSLTGFAQALGFVIGGAVVIETVFSYPGIGFTLLLAVNARDYPLMQAIFLLITVTVLIANFIADIAYVVLDPRVR